MVDDSSINNPGKFNFSKAFDSFRAEHGSEVEGIESVYEANNRLKRLFFEKLKRERVPKESELERDLIVASTDDTLREFGLGPNAFANDDLARALAYYPFERKDREMRLASILRNNALIRDDGTISGEGFQTTSYLALGGPTRLEKRTQMILASVIESRKTPSERDESEVLANSQYLCDEVQLILARRILAWSHHEAAPLYLEYKTAPDRIEKALKNPTLTPEARTVLSEALGHLRSKISNP